MSSQNFVDFVKIHCKSGSGGNGSTHFRREKYIPKGGPDGGDGGRGGHILIKGNKNLWTLLHLKYQKHFKAEHGGDGSGNRRHGAQGKDVYIDVPLGTVIRDGETQEILAEIQDDGEEFVLRKGGRGGLGNDHFKSSTNQAPRFAEDGGRLSEGWTILELKLLADVGLVGFPNAGKSTLLSVVSAAKPKIADYAFTTLKPNLGVVSYRDDRSFVMADIPGIIEGAHLGKGLGIRFLRHIERNSVLLFVVPIDSESINDEYETLLNELRQYNPELLHKNRVLAISKIDLGDEEIIEEVKSELPDIPYAFISAITQTGLAQLKDVLWQAMNKPVV